MTALESRLEPSSAADDNLEKLRELFPQAFPGGRLDVDVLRTLLGDTVDPGDERFGLGWFGKTRARQASLSRSGATLRPRPEDSIEWAQTGNVLIAGDNLEVLKLLQKSYARRVKLIYIDPPYNTGKDFVYADDYRDTIANYLRVTGQRSEDGSARQSREESTGRLHTDWLNMIYPRLTLARNLLREDGVIFVSIDDHELGTLRLVLDEIFGPECFVATIAWKKRSSPDARDTIGSVHDYIVCYVRRSDRIKDAISKMPLSEDRVEAYTNPDDDPRGDWASVDMTGMTGRATRDQFFDVTLPSGRVIGPPEGRSWGLSPATFNELRADNRIWFGRDGDNVPRIKRFLSESDGQVVPSFWDMSDVGSNDEAKKEVNDLMGAPDVFDTPKPLRLVQRMLQVGTRPDRHDIILDFFAGSGTTGHAVMEQNSRDSGNRRFILVQLPYVLDPDRKEQRAPAAFLEVAGRPRNAAELTRERLRRAGESVRQAAPATAPDIGLRVFALDSSNFRGWRGDGADIERQLFDAIENVQPGRSDEDLLYELMLNRGLDLTSPTRAVAGPDPSVVTVGERLFVCLGRIDSANAVRVAEAACNWKSGLPDPADATFIFRDGGFTDDVAKTNLYAILSQRGVKQIYTV